MPVDLASEADGVGADLLRALEEDAHAVLRAAGCRGHLLSVLLVDDEAMRRHNLAWRGKDAPTDVLSFPQDGAAGPLLGDVLIAVPYARRQAASRRHDLRTELRVLLVHGVAHLLGHDHHAPEETAAMRAVERAWLAAICGPDAPAGLVDSAAP